MKPMPETKWMRDLRRRLPPETLEHVKGELARAEVEGEQWTKPRPFLPGEPDPKRDFACGEAYQAPGAKAGKLKQCENPPTHVQYAAGGSAHGMEHTLCDSCAAKHADPSYDWDKDPGSVVGYKP